MSKLAILAVILLVGCAPAPSQDLRPFVAVAAKYSLMGRKAPQPTDGKCRSCGGKGSVGDGRVMVTCNRCNGTGNEPSSECKDGKCTSR
jgi:hypothetical protein